MAPVKGSTTFEELLSIYFPCAVRLGIDLLEAEAHSAIVANDPQILFKKGHLFPFARLQHQINGDHVIAVNPLDPGFLFEFPISDTSEIHGNGEIEKPLSPRIWERLAIYNIGVLGVVRPQAVIELNLVSTPITAKPRKLKQKWTLETTFNVYDIGLHPDIAKDVSFK